MKKIGFIDHYLHEWHADNYPKWIEEASGGTMKVCYAWAETDSPKEDGKTNRAWCDEMGIELCGSAEEVIKKSDLLIVLSPDNPERHENLCRLPLASGKRTYVDKTFAEGIDDARRIVENAKKHGTPFFSSSALRYAEEIQSRMGKDPQTVICRGPGTIENYTVHQVEPIVCLMGRGAKRVISLGGEETPTLVYDYGNGRRAVANLFGWDAGFVTTMCSPCGKVEDFTIESDFFKYLMAAMVKFFETGEPPVDAAETLAIMSMIGAGKAAAADPGVWKDVEAI
jgi:hypothetical protein